MSLLLLLVSCNQEAKYDKKQHDAFAKMIMVFSTSGAACDQISKAWLLTIEKRSLSGEEMRIALDKFLEIYNENGNLDTIEKYRSKMDIATSELINPPASRKEMYDDFLKLATKVGKFSRVVTHPSGTYRSYRDTTDELFYTIMDDMDAFSIKYGKYLRDHGVGSTDHFLKFLHYTSFLTPHDPTSKFST